MQSLGRPDAWNLLGFLEHQEGNGANSIRAFQTAIASKPDFADVKSTLEPFVEHFGYN